LSQSAKSGNIDALHLQPPGEGGRPTLKLLICAAAAAFVAQLGARPGLASNGMEDIGATVCQIGRGGAYVATGPDGGAADGNPAALALLEWPEFHLDLRFVANNIGYQGGLDAVPHATQRIAPSLGYAGPLGRGWAWGAGLRTVGGAEVQFSSLDLGLSGKPTGNYMTTLGLARRLDERTTVGAAVSYGQMAVDFHFLGDSVGFNVDGVQGSGEALRLGVYHQATARTALGAVWHSRSHLTAGSGTMTTGTYTELQGAVFEDVKMRGFNFPELYAVGLGQQLGGDWTVYAEWRRLKWDHVINTLDFLTAELEPVQLNLNWKDQDVYVLGTEYRPGGRGGAVWRAGVNYGRSAPRPRGVNPIFPNIQEWHLTAGYEDELTPRWRIAAAAVYAPENSISTLPENRYNLLFGGGQPYSVSNEGLQLGLSFIYGIGGRCTDTATAADEDDTTCDCGCASGSEDTCADCVDPAYAALGSS